MVYLLRAHLGGAGLINPIDVSIEQHRMPTKGGCLESANTTNEYIRGAMKIWGSFTGDRSIRIAGSPAS